jgi:hypothetical protein
VIEVLLPHLNEVRIAADLLHAAACDAYMRGDHRASLNRARQMLTAARLLGREPFVICHLVAIRIGGKACDVIFQVAPGLHVETPARPDAKAVTPEQMRAVIAELLDEKGLANGLRLGLLSERMAQLDTAANFISGRLEWDKVAANGQRLSLMARLGFTTMVVNDAKLMSDNMRGVMDAAASADYQTFMEAFPREMMLKLELEGESHPFAKMMLPSLERAVRTHFHAVTERRLAATALAVRWASVDAVGKLPARLADLSPRYLPAVPKDPMGVDRVLGYKPDGARPVLYSVGEDGEDDGGSEKPAPIRSDQGRWGTRDAVVPLTEP